MSNKLADETTTTAQPSSFLSVVAGAVRNLTWEAFITLLGNAIHGATNKATPVDADELALSDSAATNGLKRLSWANAKAALKSYFDGLYAASSHTQAISTVTGLQTALDDLAMDVDGKADAAATTTALAGKADLDEGGKILSSQLPSYVDDVSEAANFGALPGTGESGKIYITQDDNKTWRWSGSAYVEISSSLALGETSGSAYRGDRGKTAYDHSQASGNPHNTTLAQIGIATQAEAEAGVNTTKAMTPQRVAQAIAALGGGGGGPELSGVIWISASDGDNTTGDGTAAKPYATLQKAYDEHYAGGARVYVCHGNVGDLNAGDLDIQLISLGRAVTSAGQITATTGNPATMRGNGRHMMAVAGITVQPATAAAGAAGASPGEGGYSGSDGANAPNFEVAGLHVTNDIILRGGGGGAGGNGADGAEVTNGGPGGNGGNGGAGGDMTVRDCRVGGVITSQAGPPGSGGAGGNGGSSYTGGNGGNGGYAGGAGVVTLINTECDGYADSLAGAGGSGGPGGGGIGTGADGSAQSSGAPGGVALQFSAVGSPPGEATVYPAFAMISMAPFVGSYP